MSLRDRFKRFREDWDAAGKRLEEIQAQQDRRERKQAAEKARRVGEGECDQLGCNRPAEKDGKCMPCWSAIFGGVV